MKSTSIFEHLLPDTEGDPGFREYLTRLSLPGLQTVGIVEIASPLLLLFGRMAVAGGGLTAARAWQTAGMMLAGLGALGCTRIRFCRKRPRPAAALAAWLGPALLLAASVWKASATGTDDYILTAIMLVVITAVATVPFLPWHALLLGISIETMYFLSTHLAAQWEIVSVRAHDEAHYIFLTLLVILATGLAAVNYQHRRAEFAANQESIRVAEALTGAQLRAQLAENAISIGKMSAALSHEINSPLGALLSAVDTLSAVTDRQADAPPEVRARLAETRAQLQQSIHQSAARVEEVTKRLRRFVNLEEAELKAADLNELLSDVALLHQDELREREIRLEFYLEKELPRLTCRPQLLSAAFSTFLSNAIHAVNGDGRIEIQTRGHGSEVEVTIRDNGRGMPPEQADTIFDPSFRISGSRVSSGNWGLFSSRQIVYEHGGDIRFDTVEGRGTTVQIILPVTAG